MSDTAIIGLGSMGMGMARSALAAGIALKGYDIYAPSRDAFAEFGGTACDSVAEAARGVELLVLMVVNAAQAEDVLFGENGATAELASGATVMLCSTVAPSEARAIAAKLGDLGYDMLDAPVSGGKVGADAGTLSVMASGSPSAFEAADRMLAAMAGTVHRLGDEPGLGATYKVVHQLAAGVHLVAAAELMALGAAAGCDAQKLYDIVSGSAGMSWMFKDRVPHMLDGDYTPRSMVDIFIKDLGLVLQTGKECTAPLPLSAAAHQMLLGASGLGHGKLDDSAVVKAYEVMTGKPVRKES
ncbi:L-threonate dehydrogenase [Phaeobacter sp. J2-8]|uniref:L-threonate dehydrogenase n=1 Tax=Phaeobacter sp. J2-8 TaxID=2931394 RepID=UPI001FD1F944|nr:L-threonate dehydrogenase [Phaeobacter sp. J2-8]MCJ7872014.1 NAD(P)-binding domain-containing protein [Phaeobacter sp. J2-8]